MASIFGILNTGRQGIFTQQSAMAVTGQNIANVNTPGYSRQRVLTESLAQGGVRYMGIERITDQFLNARLYDGNARLGSSSTLALNLAQFEAALGGIDDNGLTLALQNFSGSLHDLSQQPGGTAERETVTARAEQLLTAFQGVTGQVDLIRNQLDRQVIAQVERVNNLTTAIAEINSELAQTGAADSAATQPEIARLFDERDRLVGELASVVPVREVKDNKGGLTLFAGGQVLVEGVNQRQLKVNPNPANGGLHDVVIEEFSGTYHNIGDTLSEGSLGALLQARDTYGTDAQGAIDRLAATLARDINMQHRQGVGLDGIGGRDFFTGLTASAVAAAVNTGGVEVTSASITNPAQLTFEDYEIRFTAADRYSIVNTTTGATLTSNAVYASGSAIDFGGMRVVLTDGASAPSAGDVVQVNSYSGTAERLSVSAAITNDPRAIAAGLTPAVGDNSNALKLSELFNTSRVGTETYEGFFTSVRLRISMGVSNAQTAETDAQITQQQVQGLREATSGVSLDEEATNIIQYQRAFEAASRVVRVTDELLQSLLQIV